MNLMGKIFTVLIFLFSIVFACFALAVYATQTNWRLVADNDKPPEGLAQRLEKKNKENEDLSSQKKELEKQFKAEKDRWDNRKSTLETDNDLLRKGRAAAEAEAVLSDKKARALAQALQADHQTLLNLRDEVELLRKDILAARADRDATFDKYVKMTDEARKAEAEVERLQKSVAAVGEKLAGVQTILQYFHLTKNSMAESPPPEFQGRVLAVKPPDMLEISGGSDDGLREKHVLFLLRPGEGGMKYIGKIVILKVSPDRAVCRYDVKQLTGPVQPNDFVRAKLD
jgi:hypothetical protein